MNVYVVDIGTEESSRGKENFAWICDDDRCGNRLCSLWTCIEEDLMQKHQISIGFESPLFFDVFDERVNQQRKIDEGSPWTSSVGASVTVTGLTQIFWLFRKLSGIFPALKVEVLKDLKQLGGEANVYVWEAFVSKGAKFASQDPKKDPKALDAHPNAHIEDCKTALAHYQWMLAHPDQPSVYDNKPGLECVSLIGALLLRAGLSTDLAVLRCRPLIVKPGQANDQYESFKWGRG